MAFIEITAIGNVGQQPQINTMPSGDQVANFSLASTTKWKDKATGEPRERTEWIKVSVFGGLVNVVSQFVGQGSKLFVKGEYRTNKYMKDGVEVIGVELRAEKIELLGEPKGQQAGANNNQSYQAAPQQAPQQGYQQAPRQQAPQQGYQQAPRQQAPQQGYQQGRQQAPQQGYQKNAQRQPAPQQGYQQPAYNQQDQFSEYDHP